MDMQYKNEALNEIVAVSRFKDIDLSDIDKCFPVKIGSLCTILNLVAEHDYDLKDGHSGCLEGNKILVNPYYGSGRQRFTIAHEIGHYVLHGTNGNRYDDTFKYTPEEKQREIEANSFAAKLLMPEEEFTNVFKKYFDDEWKVAEYFGVSRSSILFRAINLGLINNA